MEPERSSPEASPPEPSARLNDLLCEVLDYLLENAQHADFFRAAVSCVIVDDYRNFVPADKEMYLGRMLERARQKQYLSVANFRADLQLMHENAAAYNGRNGGKHAYKPVMHWAADIIAAAEEQLQRRMFEFTDAEAELQAKRHQSDIACKEAEATTTATALTASPCSKPTDAALGPACEGPSSAAAQQDPQPQQQQQEQPQPQRQQQQQQEEPRKRRPAGASGSSPRAGADGGNGSAGQQSSSPSSGSGDGSHSGLEALLAACELAAEQDSAEAVPRSGAGKAGTGGAPDTKPPERRSYPGCGASPSGRGGAGANASERPPATATQMALAVVPAGQQQAGAAVLHEEHAGSSEDGPGGVATARSAGVEAGVTASTVQQPGTGGSGGGGGGGGAAANSSYLTSNAFKNRRHKSKVYIKPNKVVYLPTTFVEEEFNVMTLPLDCELRVEADGVLTDEVFRVTIKAVPRQGLSTMYCMTNVMRFQQQYLNWQIYNWTRIDNDHIKIHLQSPSPGQGPPPRPDLDRAASLPDVGRGAPCRMSDDGGAVHPRPVGGGALKRKSDTGRYNVTKVERRVVVEPMRGGDWPMDLRISTNGYMHRPSPIPESPPASPQRQVSAAAYSQLPSSRFTGVAHALPPRVPLHAAAAQHVHLYHALQQQQHQQQHSLGLPFALPPRGPAAAHLAHAVTLKHEFQAGGADAPGPVEVPGPYGFTHAAPQQSGRISACGTAGAATGGGGGGSGSARSSSTQLEQHIQELIVAAGGGHQVAPELAALQLALVSLQQQQQQSAQQQQNANDSDGEAAPLDLAIVPAGDGAQQQQQQAASLQGMQQHRAARGGGGGIHCLDLQRGAVVRGDAGNSDVDDGEYDMGGGGCNSNGRLHTVAPVMSQHREAPPRRVSLLDGAAGGGGGAAGRQPQGRLPQQIPKDRTPQDMEEDGDVDITDDQHPHAVIHRPYGGSSGANGRALPQFAAPLLGLGRVVFDLGAGGNTVAVSGGRAAGGRRGNGGGAASMAAVNAAAAGDGAPTYATLDLSTCAGAELMSLLSPSKRFKISVAPGQLQAAAAAVAEAGGPIAINGMDQHLGLLEAMAALRAGQLGPSVDSAALAALRGPGGAFTTATIGGRPTLVQMGPELMGQLM